MRTNEYSTCPIDTAIGLLALLISSGRSAEAHLDEALARERLTFAKWRALDALAGSAEAVHLKDLSQRLHCAKSNVTQLVDKLETEGLALRSPDPSDRRGTLVHLTDQGRAAHQAGRRVLAATTEAVFEACSQFDREALRRLLVRLRRDPAR